VHEGSNVFPVQEREARLVKRVGGEVGESYFKKRIKDRFCMPPKKDTGDTERAHQGQSARRWLASCERKRKERPSKTSGKRSRGIQSHTGPPCP